MWKLLRKRYGLCRTAASVLESGAAVCARQRSSAVRTLGTEARGGGGGLPGDSTSHAVPARRWGIRRTSCDSPGRGKGGLGSLYLVPSLGSLCPVSFPWNNSRLQARLF